MYHQPLRATPELDDYLALVFYNESSEHNLCFLSSMTCALVTRH